MRIESWSPAPTSRPAGAPSPRTAASPADAAPSTLPVETRDIRSPFAPAAHGGVEAEVQPVRTTLEDAAQVGATVQRNVTGRLLGVVGLALVSLGALSGLAQAEPPSPPPESTQSATLPVEAEQAADLGDLQQQPGESFEDFMQRMVQAKQDALRSAHQARPTAPTGDRTVPARTSVTVTAHGYWEGEDFHGVQEIRIWENHDYHNRSSNTYTNYGNPPSQTLTMKSARPGKACRVQVTWEGGVSRTYDVPVEKDGRPASFDAWKY